MTDARLSASRIGRYDLVSVLGRGGMGVVYDAVDPQLGRHVALKTLPPEVSGDAGRLARFMREARAASALNHPNVVSIYEIGRDTVGAEDVHFIAMEKVDGKTLRSTLDGSRLPVAQVIELVAQVADAMAAAHTAGIVHRDLKPENIVVTPHGTAKVLDFGLAKLHASDALDSLDSATAVKETASGVILGTVGYMSPEQATGKTADTRSDIFSLGCVLYEALSWRRAFASGSSVETLNAIIHAEPPPIRATNSGVSEEQQRITRKAMAKNPDERYQSAKEMAIDLRTSLRSAPPAGRARRPLVAAMLAVAMVIGALTGLLLWKRNAEKAETASTVAADLPKAPLVARRITSRGTVNHASISPDARFLAYKLLDSSLRLRQLTTNEELELLPPGKPRAWGLTFLPDGDSLLYAVKDPADPVGSLFRIASIGGRPQHLLDGVDTSPSVSPDGRHVTWGRAEHPQRGQSALMVANIDGSDVRVLATRTVPERFAPLFFGGPAWSPDGKWIAATVQRDAEPVGSRVVLIDPASGREKVFVDSGWQLITRCAWLADGSGIIAPASKDANDPSSLRLTLFPYPAGEPRAITPELSAYRGISVARGDVLASLSVEIDSQAWSISLSDSGAADKVTTGRTDGWRGLTVLPDGRIVMSSFEDAGQILVVSNPDGSGRTRLTRDRDNSRHPAAFRDGVAYVSLTPGWNEVRVVDFQGESRRVVVRDVSDSPIAVSPDGAWLAFRRNRRVWKTPMAGGTPTQLVGEVSSTPAWSRKGDRLAVILGDPETYAGKAAVISAADGKVLWTAPLPSVHPGTILRWLPDDAGLIVNGGPNDDRNLWRIPFDGPPARITDFKDLRAYFWDFTPDGKSAILARANITRDAVVITGFR
ncbi:MAG TPA: protein kinase [Thermoanaerobaculia bacterium]|nr:protein kinase [Thermoanaerobaculia bacterium]